MTDSVIVDIVVSRLLTFTYTSQIMRLALQFYARP
jgi:hypothetical protein